MRCLLIWLFLNILLLICPSAVHLGSPLRGPVLTHRPSLIIFLVLHTRHLTLSAVVLVLAAIKHIAVSSLWVLLVIVVLVFVILAPLVVKLRIEIPATARVWLRIAATILVRVVKWWLHLLFGIVPIIGSPRLLLALLLIVLLILIPLKMTTAIAILLLRLPLLSFLPVLLPIPIIIPIFVLILVF